jgi:plasmid stabilization system protein ParE
MPYCIKITPEAAQEIRHELARSRKHWGAPHASKYRKGFAACLKRIAANPLQYALKPHYGEGVRAVLYKGNYIVYVVDPARNLVQVIGFPHAHARPRKVPAYLKN